MTRIAIVGAGLAGSSLTHWLLKSEFDDMLFDGRDPMTGSVGPIVPPFSRRPLALTFLQEVVQSTVQPCIW